MITLPNGTRIGLGAGMTDMRRGFEGLAAIAQEKLGADPFSSHLFIFVSVRPTPS
jgi:transposase